MILFTLLNYIAASHGLSGTNENDSGTNSPKKSAESRLIEHLIGKYDNVLARPRINSSQAVNVDFYITLYYIVDLDEKNQVLTTYLGKQHRWYDDYLVWDPNDFLGIKRIVIPCNKIWTPNVILISNLDQEKSEKSLLEMKEVAVTWDGRCVWGTTSVYRSPCLVDMENFPFDVQRCHLLFGSWMYSKEQVQLDIRNNSHFYGLNTHEMVKNMEWALIDHFVQRETLGDAHDKGEQFDDMVVTLVMERNSNYYAKFTLLPVLMLTVLVLVIFWIPPFRPDRTSLGTSLFASFMLMLLLVVQLSPPSSGVKLDHGIYGNDKEMHASFQATCASNLGAYCCIQMLLIALATLLSVMVVNLSQRNDPVPRWIKLVFFQGVDQLIHCKFCHWKNWNGLSVDKVCCIDTTLKESDYLKRMRKSLNIKSSSMPPDENPTRIPPDHGRDWKRLALILDRIFFIVYTVIIIVFFTLYFPRPAMGNFNVLTRRHHD